MTDNAKKALEFLKDNEEVSERFKKAKDVKEMLDLAKEYNFDLTEEDLGITTEKKEFLEGKRKMDINELSKISGAGDVCVCVAVGGGDAFGIVCGCFLGGWGAIQSGGNTRKVTCACAIGGGGTYDTDLGTTGGC